MNVVRLIREWWSRLREPKVERTVMVLIYGLAFCMGASIMLGPPSQVEGAIGLTLTHTWAILLMVCGVFGAYGVIPGAWWAERVAATAGTTGAMIYAAVLAYLQLTTPGNRLPGTFAALIVAVLFVGRRYRVRGVNYEPRPERG